MKWFEGTDRARGLLARNGFAVVMAEATAQDIADRVVRARVVLPMAATAVVLAPGVAEAIEAARAEPSDMGPHEQAAFDAGVACALEGPDTTNCHFKHFASPVLTAAWQRGKAVADEQVYDTRRELEAGDDW